MFFHNSQVEGEESAEDSWNDDSDDDDEIFAPGNDRSDNYRSKPGMNE